MDYNRKKVLAVASFGGHWRQLMYLKDAFAGLDVSYLTTVGNEPTAPHVEKYYTVSDCNKNTPIKTIKALFQIALLVFKYRPDIVITTGAAPGLLAIGAARLIGAKTIWVDSIANSKQLSLCGKLSKYIAHKTLSQWEPVARDNGVLYEGSVL
tara:strand:+ start:5407 stop:5865 length:459 start_codon:yes stop_codon:yes gene_type:complete